MTKPAIVTPLEHAPLSPSTGGRAAAEGCPSCGGAIDGRFCGTCGERRPSGRVYSLRAFAHEAFEAVTNVERSFLRTVWTLIRRPGELTAAYMRGERVGYLRPLQLFLLVSVAYFLWAGWSGVRVFNTPFLNHVTTSEYKTLALEIVRRELPASRMTEARYTEAFDAKSAVLARSMIVVMVPMLALVVAALSFRKRRPAVQHLVFSLHFFSMLLLLTIVTEHVVNLVLLAWSMVAEPSSRWQVKDSLEAAAIAAAIIVYSVPAFRRAYGDGRVVAMLKALALLVALAVIIVAFRFLLFYTTVQLI